MVTKGISTKLGARREIQIDAGSKKCGTCQVVLVKFKEFLGEL
jgi:hypothetical protein